MNIKAIQPMNNVNKALPTQAKRNYKDTLFRMIFQEPTELLQLYNAINGTNYSNPALELRVIQLNINVGQNEKLMEKCQTLREYALYVDRVRKYAKKLPLNKAVNLSVQECIKEGILTEFLTKYKAEAISMSIFEYDEERELALIRHDEREIGTLAGLQQGIEAFILDNLEEGIPKERILEKLIRRFSLTQEQALTYFSSYAPEE